MKILDRISMIAQVGDNMPASRTHFRSVLTIGVMMLLMLIISAPGLGLAAELPQTGVTVTDMGGGLYQCDVVLYNVTDLAGVSFDLPVDTTTYEVVDATGASVTGEPMIPGSLFADMTNDYVLVNRFQAGQLTYVELLVGVADGGGVDYLETTVVTTFYLKDIDGLGLSAPEFQVADTFEGMSDSVACVKLSDSYAAPIVFEAYNNIVNLILQVLESAGTLEDGTYDYELVIQNPGSLAERVPASQLTIVSGAVDITLTLNRDFESGTSFQIALLGYYSDPVVITNDGTGNDITEAVSLTPGDINGDLGVNDSDLLFFAERLGNTVTSTDVEYVHDGVLNLQDLFYITSNFGLGE